VHAACPLFAIRIELPSFEARRSVSVIKFLSAAPGLSAGAAIATVADQVAMSMPGGCRLAGTHGGAYLTHTPGRNGCRPRVQGSVCVKCSTVLARSRGPLPPLAPGNGWQSIQTLHTLEEFRDLVSCVRRLAGGILRFLKVGYDAFEISACWATVLATGAVHRVHHHPNNYLSAVYYLRTHPGADTINFTTHGARPGSSNRRSSISRPTIPIRWS